MRLLILMIIGVLSGGSALALSLDEKLEVLVAHNSLRKLHHAPNLVWDNALAKFAESYGKNCVFKHSGNKAYGENLAAGYPTITAAVNDWYAEKDKYSFTKPGLTKGAGHFTQVIWKSTEKLGCANVPCNGKNGTPGNFLVCEYSPAGNIVNEGYFQANVLPH